MLPTSRQSPSSPHESLHSLSRKTTPSLIVSSALNPPFRLESNLSPRRVSLPRLLILPCKLVGLLSVASSSHRSTPPLLVFASILPLLALFPMPILISCRSKHLQTFIGSLERAGPPHHPRLQHRFLPLSRSEAILRVGRSQSS